jgi:hypothetical protein
MKFNLPDFSEFGNKIFIAGLNKIEIASFIIYHIFYNIFIPFCSCTDAMTEKIASLTFHDI